MRLFIAIDPPPDVLDHLAATTAELAVTRAGVRVTARELWHITLAFIGDIPDDRLPAARTALDRAALSGSAPDRAARIAADRAELDRAELDRAELDRAELDRAELDRAEMERAEMERAGQAVGEGGTEPARPVLRLAGGGRFGRGKFTILWAGVEGDLRELRAAVTRELRRARLPFDAKRFHPHLTLSRPGDRLPAADVEGDVARLGEYVGPQWTVEEIRLVRSYLGPKPVYETVHRGRLP